METEEKYLEEDFESEFGEENKNLELLVEPFDKLWRKIDAQFNKIG